MYRAIDISKIYLFPKITADFVAKMLLCANLLPEDG